jgi:hypothetical protein
MIFGNELAAKLAGQAANDFSYWAQMGIARCLKEGQLLTNPDVGTARGV